MGRVATKLAPLKPVLAFHFHVRHNYGQHLFMNIDSRYPVRHCLPPGGSGERAAVTLTRVAGYRRSHRGTQQRPSMKASVLSSKKFKTAKNLKQFKKARKNF